VTRDGPSKWTGSTDGTAVGERYDWWSRHPQAFDLLYDLAFFGREDTFRDRAFDALDAQAGDAVLEVGCGPGNSFAPIRDQIGSRGTLVGVDVSQGMIRAAERRVREEDWENVHAVRGDARQLPFGRGAFDLAFASMSLSAVPEPGRAIEAVERALVPGGELIVLDAQPFQRGGWRLLNPFLIPIAEYATKWVPDVDLLAALRDTFGTVDVSTFYGESLLVVRAEKS